MKYTYDKICVIGLGYIGLPTAAIIASNGIKVLGVDINKDVVDKVNSGSAHIVEPGLSTLVKTVINTGFLHASLSPETSDAFIIAVPTPFSNEGNNEIPLPNLDYIKSAVESISMLLKRGDLIILESTSPVGTTEKISEWLADLRPDLIFPHIDEELCDIFVAYCPERVLPGNSLLELVKNDRIIGGLSQKCSQRAKALYQIFVNGTLHLSNAKTAELCKLTENSFRDVNIAFANELSLICDDLGIDVWELVKLANYHPRVDILRPGPGVGGHCIAVDPWFIVNSSPTNSKLITTARRVNDNKPSWVISKFKNSVLNIINHNSELTPEKIKVACFGLSFKPNIDDLRESPSLEIVLNIAKLHPGSVFVVEPNINNLPKDLFLPNIFLVEKNIATASADIILLLVAHTEFLNLENSSFHSKTHIIDCCGILSN